MPSAISSKKNTSPAGCLIFIFAVFAIVGLSIFTTNFVVPMAGIWRAQSWTPTACMIQSSSVTVRGSGDESKFYPEVKYVYSFNKQIYSASQLSPFKIARNSTSDAQSFINAYPSGASSRCFVNPRNPEQAILSRSVPREAAFNLIPLLFVCAGLAGIFWQVNSSRQAKRNEARGVANWKPKVALGQEPNVSLSSRSNASTYSLPDGQSGAIVLKPAATRTGGCLAIGLFSLFWNGFIGFALWNLVFQNKGFGFARIFPILFLIPFILVGILMLFASLSCFATLFNSRVTLRMSTPQAIPGSNFELSWELRKSFFNPQSWSLSLEAREEATYTRGTDTVTDKSVFYTRDIFATNSFETMKNGRQTVAIPEGAMHSFAAPHNKVIWNIKVHGAPAFGVAIKEEYEIIVAPATSHQ